MSEMSPLDVAVESLTFVAESLGKSDAVPAPSDAEIAEAEVALGVKLPPSYVRFMQRAGSVLMADWDIYWVGDQCTTLRNIVMANEIEREHDTSPLPKFLIAFCDDGTGDQYCFDTRERTMPGTDQSIELKGLAGVGDEEAATAEGEYPVVMLDRSRGLEQIREGLYVVATDFVDWLKQEVHEST